MGQRHRLEKEHRIVVAYCGDHQAPRISRSCGHHHFQAGHVEEPGRVVLRVSTIWAVANARAHDDRHTRSATGHVMQIRSLVDELIHRRWNEFTKTYFDNRALSE